MARPELELRPCAIMAAHYHSCPTSIVSAPVELVWMLLTRPEGWADFYDIRVTAVNPAGPAMVGQTIFAESGPCFLHLKVELRYVEIDIENYKLALHVQLPLGITVIEDMTCLSLSQNQCRVTYNCGFNFPAGWRGTLLRLFLRRQLDSGPLDSLARLQQAAEQLQAKSARVWQI